MCFSSELRGRNLNYWTDEYLLTFEVGSTKGVRGEVARMLCRGRRCVLLIETPVRRECPRWT